jgi:hypothetical protein
MDLVKQYFKEHIIPIALGIIILLNLATIFYVNKAIYDLKGQNIVLTNKLNSLTVDTKGKLEETSKDIKALAEATASSNMKQEITYTKKDSDEDADVELKQSPAYVSVKVNDGKKYNFKLLPEENTKFEDGKLIIDQTYNTHLNIKASEYKKSKWQLITAMNSDKEVLGGLNYELGHTVSATWLVGQGIKPYYGLVWRIGAHD